MLDKSTDTKGPVIIHHRATKTVTNEDILVYNNRKKRVAAYARVSTDDEEQATSYAAQVSYYTEKIQENPDWEFVGIYADEGITGTSVKKRKEFQRMIQDAMDGKIDIILTKSISRFARNTEDSVHYSKALAEKGVQILFEKENIDSLDPKSAIAFSIFSSLAQEESRSISDNVTWGIQKRMKDGRVCMAYKQFLGYRKGPDGKPEIVPEEAEIVKDIYDMYLSGYSLNDIKHSLEAQKILSPGGKPRWSKTTVRSILSNEKYKGDAKLQKTYSENFLTKKRLVNSGQRDSYYVAGSHPAIIDRQTFDLVQIELENRSNYKEATSARDLFARRIICSECGETFGRKTWNNKNGKKYYFWCCNHKYSNPDTRDKICSVPNLKEEAIKNSFCMVMNRILKLRNEYIEVNEQRIKKLEKQIEQSVNNSEIENLNQEIAELIQSAEKHYEQSLNIKSVATTKHLDVLATVEAKKEELKLLELEQLEPLKRAVRLKRYVETLRKCGDNFNDFRKDIWFDTVKKVSVSEKELTYHMFDGETFIVKLTDLD